MSRRGSTEKLGDVLASLLQRRGYGRPLALQTWRDAWGRAAGVRLAARTRVASYRDGTLTVEVSSAAQRYELEAFEAARLLAALHQDPTTAGLRRLVFRAGSASA
jgi:predicted nucleic acid-binding Zn ribbon protein